MFQIGLGGEILVVQHTLSGLAGLDVGLLKILLQLFLCLTADLDIESAQSAFGKASENMLNIELLKLVENAWL